MEILVDGGEIEEVFLGNFNYIEKFLYWIKFVVFCVVSFFYFFVVLIFFNLLNCGWLLNFCGVVY